MLLKIVILKNLSPGAAWENICWLIESEGLFSFFSFLSFPNVWGWVGGEGWGRGFGLVVVVVEKKTFTSIH